MSTCDNCGAELGAENPGTYGGPGAVCLDGCDTRGPLVRVQYISTEGPGGQRRAGWHEMGALEVAKLLNRAELYQEREAKRQALRLELEKLEEEQAAEWADMTDPGSDPSQPRPFLNEKDPASRERHARSRLVWDGIAAVNKADRMKLEGLDAEPVREASK